MEISGAGDGNRTQDDQARTLYQSTASKRPELRRVIRM